MNILVNRKFKFFLGKKRSKNDDNELYNCGKILDMMTECGFSDISEIDKDEYEENQTQECRQS